MSASCRADSLREPGAEVVLRQPGEAVVVVVVVVVVVGRGGP
ncbi:MAG TPA: hypothetical protein VGL95_09530 [Acetobacteraceae bacterium]